ncbi:MAG: dihydroorotate dehydrogenase electron transfer subunit [Desulfovibrio sp.]|jgi:dihydroorotate dehydrogenase electron transfer subunit|nr:dihydroorotate dehydrogenase electron transfer subunit [Desulfovibrio sp.]
MPQPILAQLTVTHVEPLGGIDAQAAFFLMRLTLPPWDGWKPGQFIMLRPAGGDAGRLWGRPFSICRADDANLCVFFQARGRATMAMAEFATGTILDAWGPLGNALAVEDDTPTLLLAGGVGIAPFVGYVHAHPRPENLIMEFGHRMPLPCYPFEGIRTKISANAHREKEAGDREGFLHLLDDRIRQFSAEGLVLACGPTPFLEAVQTFSLRYKARTQLCLETRMACGIGACLGCVVKAALPPKARPDRKMPEKYAPPGSAARAEYHHVQTCICGPNFWADTVSLR